MVGNTLSHYRILEELGRGGMGIVYLAEDTKLGRPVAIKVLPSAALASEIERARFYREAKAAAQLHHPHIASVFEIDEAIPEGSMDDDLRPFISMEFIEGETLSEQIQIGPLKLADAVRIAVQIASGLEAAHEKDIVHRDLKSQNVMLTAKKEAKILDFGLAQTAASTKLTRMGSTLGTIAYMSPEQAQGSPVDCRTDLWSLGVVLYEMIAGITPFPGEYDKAVIYNILNQEPEPLTAIRTGVPMELERITNKLLKKDASRRYQSATELIVDLKDVKQVLDIGSTRSGTKSSVASMEKSTEAPRIPVRMTIIAFIGIGLAFLLGMLVSGSDSDGDPAFFDLVIEAGLEFGSPSWSFDDERVYYVRIVDEWDTIVESYNVTTGARQSYIETRGASFVQASPEDESFVFQRGATTYHVRPDLSEPVPLVENVGWNSIRWTSGNELIYTLMGKDTVLSFDLTTGEVDTILVRSEYDSSPGCCGLYFLVGTPDKKTLHFGLNQGSEPGLLIELNRSTGVESIVGEGFPLDRTGSGQLVAYGLDLLPTAYPLDRLGRVSGAGRLLSHLIGLDISPAGHAIFKPAESISSNGEPIHSVQTDGTRIFFGAVPGSPSISDLTVSPDGKILVKAGDYLDEGRRLVVYDLEDRTSRALDVGFDPLAPQFAADGWIYFNDAADVRSIYKARIFDAGLEDFRIVYSDSLTARGPWASATGLVAFHRDVNGAFRVFVYDESGDMLEQITNQTGNQYNASLHPSAPVVAYTHVFEPSRSIIAQNLESGVRINVSDQGPVALPRFGHDGRWLYFLRGISVIRVPVIIGNGTVSFGAEETVAFQPFSDHIHYAPGVGDVLVYTAAPPSPRDSEQAYRLVLNYDQYLAKLIGE